MNRLRTLTGALALVLIVIALNITAVRRDVFSGAVIALFVAGGAAMIVYAILSFLHRRGSAEIRRDSNVNGIVASIIFLCICIVAYAFVKKWDRTWDLTEEGRTELAPQTIQVLQGLTQDVTAYGLFTVDLMTQQRELQVAQDKTRLFLERCAKLTPHLKIEFIDPQTDTLRLREMGMTYADPRGTVVLKSGARMRTIPLGGEKAQPRLEERDFTNTLINIVQDAQPKIGFLAGHGEVDISRPEMARLKKLLELEGYKVEPMAIRPGEGGIEDDYSVVVINGLNAEVGGDLTVDELTALDNYISSGGRLLLLTDPQFAEGLTETRKRVLDWLQQRFGIVVGEDLIISRIDKRLGEVTLMSDADATSIFRQVDVPDVDFTGCYDQGSPITKNFNKQMLFAAARSVTLDTKLPDRVTGIQVLRTMPYCWAETNLSALRQGGKPAPDPNERSGSIGLSASATLQTEIPVGDSGQMKTSRAVVIGDSDFIQGESILNGGNLNFIMNTFAWLTEREQLIAIRPLGKENPPIKLTEADETAITWIAGMGVVQGVLLLAFLAYMLRKRYR